MARRTPNNLTKLQAWVVELESRVGRNKAAVAFANKIARIAWAIWRYDRPFSGSFAAAYSNSLHWLRRQERSHAKTGTSYRGQIRASKPAATYGSPCADCMTAKCQRLTSTGRIYDCNPLFCPGFNSRPCRGSPCTIVWHIRQSNKPPHP